MIAAIKTAAAAISLTKPACFEKSGETRFVNCSIAVLKSSATTTNPNIAISVTHSIGFKLSQKPSIVTTITDRQCILKFSSELNAYLTP